MQLYITAADEIPIYRQLIRQISQAIASGRVAAGDRLPSHRDLAEQLVIAPLTVKKAYDELEALGYIESQRGRGTFVAERVPRKASLQSREELERLAIRLVTSARLAGLNLAETVRLVKDANHQLLTVNEEILEEKA